ncbi:MAG: type 1 glutamine amidotransferase [Candidatus Cloacimonetes bacterium]|nr:type 1 glutamine amidotransferase [Candidatus Cloacimonadota bacterium]
MLLLLNLVVNLKDREKLDNLMANVLDFTGYRTVNLDDDWNSIQPEDFSHLVLTGSEASASEDNPWDSRLLKFTRQALKDQKSILGICYGHQMLAKAIGDNPVVRRATNPELGYYHIELTDDELFRGLDNPVFAQSHFDEVAFAPPDCTSIASNENRSVQGFRLIGKHVWGLQFHPEFDFTFAENLYADVFNNHPELQQLYNEIQESPEHLLQNRLIYRNFLETE